MSGIPPDNLGQNLRAARALLKWSQGRLADEVGVSKLAIGNLEAGANQPSPKTYKQIIRVLTSAGVRIDPHGVSLVEKESDDGSKINIPLVSSHASAGFGVQGQDGLKQSYLDLNPAWIRTALHLNPTDLFCVEAVGVSMEPTIKANELLLVSKAERHKRLDDGIYVIRLDGNVHVKRLQTLPGGRLRVISDNTSYEPYEIKMTDEGIDMEIIGKVVMVHGMRQL